MQASRDIEGLEAVIAITQAVRVPRARACVLLGPAFVASVAYVDPGNIATNVTAGSRYGYALVWVVVGAILLASLLQYLSAKLGIATGMSLAEAARQTYSRRTTAALGIQACVMMIATDLAEVVGGAIGLQLLCKVPLPIGGLITGIASLALLAVRGRTQRKFEGVILVFLVVMLAGFLAGVLAAPPPGRALAHGLVPTLPDAGALPLAIGMLGATIMPHALYLHSGLMPDRFPGSSRDGAESARLLSASRVDILLAMLLAGTVNVAMILLAAGALGGSGIESLQGAHAGLAAALGGGVSLCFAIALLASGLASAAVGTHAGSVVVDGFSRRRLPLVARRGLTIAPAIAILCTGFGPTQALILSQVMLSFGIPAAVIPLVRITSDPKVMGALANRPLTRRSGIGAAVLITSLNVAVVVMILVR